jgi:hypothetical protein
MMESIFGNIGRTSHDLMRPSQFNKDITPNQGIGDTLQKTRIRFELEAVLSKYFHFNL